MAVEAGEGRPGMNAAIASATRAVAEPSPMINRNPPWDGT
ncbi:hypothetical protein C791_5145 [Amycolatopsis azurea DSM 43854]|uniref:Uncharacterized protein n=1 Tax=Amycolatopsis azurea DSM 43854 TaxID=1238180 RepID=M2QEF0_9PSEU|nr:hypothetical protein C791_5145 [Amycolatopsis azurea DSM 43854]